MTGPGTGPGSGPAGPPVPVTCASPGCIAAQNTLVDARNDIIGTCASITDLNGRASALLGIVGGMLGIAGAIITILGSTIGWAATIALLTTAAIVSNGLLLFILAAVVLALIAVAIALLIAYIALLAAVAFQEGQLNGKRMTFQSALTALRKACPNSCGVDTSLPSC